jgi:phosphatidylethanolamine/phosphatidyl-N-methylethanolamine N-methyltransferase
MSVFFFKRFLSNPRQVAYIVPSSKVLINRALSKFDFSEPRVIVEYGGGEGCITREIVRRMHPSSTVLIFELDPVFVNHLRQQFRHDPRVHIIYADAGELPAELAKRGFQHCDHIVSGIPFSTMESDKKKALLQQTYDALAPMPTSVFVTYQVTNELRQHATIFPRADSKYCLQNIPPMFIAAFYKLALPKLNGHNGHAKKEHREYAHAGNGNGRF